MLDHRMRVGAVYILISDLTLSELHRSLAALDLGRIQIDEGPPDALHWLRLRLEIELLRRNLNL